MLAEAPGEQTPAQLCDGEATRFWAHVVRGPGERDCWLWTGAIADDGYGRFWLKTSEGQRVVRPHRFAYALVAGLSPTDLERLPVVEHLRCDNPICVRADGTHLDHLAASTQSANLARMGERHRGGGDPHTYRFTTTDRASLAARSRALREAVRDGWDETRIADALASCRPGQLRLW